MLLSLLKVLLHPKKTVFTREKTPAFKIKKLSLFWGHIAVLGNSTSTKLYRQKRVQSRERYHAY